MVKSNHRLVSGMDDWVGDHTQVAGNQPLPAVQKLVPFSPRFCPALRTSPSAMRFAGPRYPHCRVVHPAGFLPVHNAAALDTVTDRNQRPERPLMPSRPGRRHARLGPAAADSKTLDCRAHRPSMPAQRGTKLGVGGSAPLRWPNRCNAAISAAGCGPCTISGEEIRPGFCGPPARQTKEVLATADQVAAVPAPPGGGRLTWHCTVGQRCSTGMRGRSCGRPVAATSSR
jgi:hypothetical protein